MNMQNMQFTQRARTSGMNRFSLLGLLIRMIAMCL
jgi:hypothetical protein